MKQETQHAQLSLIQPFLSYKTPYRYLDRYQTYVNMNSEIPFINDKNIT